MLFDSGTVQPTFSAQDVGVGGESLTFKLTVTDTGDLYEEDSCVISVEWQIEYKLFGLNFSP
jgi:hypothetical protein